MGNSHIELVEPLKIADARAGLYHLFIRDLTLKCFIGVHKHEQKNTQSVRVNMDMSVRENPKNLDDDIGNTVCYEKIAAAVREITASRHFNLVETLADEIATMCLENSSVRSARVRVEKTDVFADVQSVGIEIERFNTKV